MAWGDDDVSEEEFNDAIEAMDTFDANTPDVEGSESGRNNSGGPAPEKMKEMAVSTTKKLMESLTGGKKGKPDDEVSDAEFDAADAQITANESLDGVEGSEGDSPWAALLSAASVPLTGPVGLANFFNEVSKLPDYGEYQGNNFMTDSGENDGGGTLSIPTKEESTTSEGDVAEGITGESEVGISNLLEMSGLTGSADTLDEEDKDRRKNIKKKKLGARGLQIPLIAGNTSTSKGGINNG